MLGLSNVDYFCNRRQYSHITPYITQRKKEERKEDEEKKERKKTKKEGKTKKGGELSVLYITYFINFLSFKKQIF